MKNLQKIIENIIFSSRWFLTPFYLGLIIVLFLYEWTYLKEVLNLILEIHKLNKNDMMLIILEIVDMVMIANLVKMIITGSYNSFVSKEHGFKNEKATSGILKVKMGTSLIGVSSIHLLKSFIKIESVSMEDLKKMVIIHGSFLIGAVLLMLIEYIHIKGERLEYGIEKATH